MTTVSLGIDLESTFDETTALSLWQASHLLRGRDNAKSPHIECMRRWANPNRGCVVNGTQILLPTIRHGGRLLTTPAWVEAFKRARARLGVRVVPPPLARPRTQREAAQRRAEQVLRDAGIG